MKKHFVKIIAVVIAIAIIAACFCGFSSTGSSSGSSSDKAATLEVGNKLAENQPTPTDIDYSLERYNLIRRTYWVNGQQEKARNLPCEIEKPLSYIALMLDGVGVVSTHIVDGKVSSLNSFLTPDSEYYEYSAGESSARNKWLPDIDGSYGENDTGIFFFTPDGKYIEWTGTYLYSDIPFEVDNPVLKVAAENG